MEKRFTFYIVAIVVVLAIAFFSQQPYSQDIIKNIASYINKYGGASLLGGIRSNILGANLSNNSSASSSDANNNTNATINDTNSSANSYKLTESAYNSSSASTIEQTGLTMTNLTSIPKKVAEGLKSGGEAISNSVNSTTEKISQNISTAEKNVVNYFSGISDAIQGKEINSGTCQCPAGQ